MLISLTLFQITNPVLPGVTGAGTGEAALGSIIGAVVGIMTLIGAIAALIYLLLGALSWITSAGDKTKLEKAQQQITQALVGLILLVSVWAIMLLVGQFTGLGFPNLIIPRIGQSTAGGGGSGSTGNASCGCYNGGCATVGTLAPLGSLGNNTYGPCYTCTETGWDNTGPDTCAPVVCGACS